MQITAKIQSLLADKSHLTFEELLQYGEKKAVMEAIYRYGMTHRDEVICSCIARNMDNGSVVMGKFRIGEIMNLSQSGKLKFEKLMPIGIIQQNGRVSCLTEGKTPQARQKIGQIIPRKMFTKQVLKQEPKSIKKSTQKPAESKTKPMEKSKQNVSKIKPVTIPKQQPLKLEKTDSKVTQISRSKKLTVQSDSENESDLVKRYNIEPPTTSKTQPKIEEEKVEKFEEEKKQIIAKVAQIDIDIDDDEAAFALIMLNKQKAKAENKPTTVNQKVQEQKTEVKKEIKAVKPPPPMPSSAAKPTPNNKGTLFAFMKNNVART